MLSEATSGFRRSAGCSRSSIDIVGAPPVVRFTTTSLAALTLGRNCLKSSGSCVGLPSFGLRAWKCTIAAPACAAPIAASAISSGVTGRYGDMLGVWIEPVTAQVMMTLPCGADIAFRFFTENSYSERKEKSHQIPGTATDGNRLSGNMLSRIGRKKERRVGDVLRADGRMHAHAFEQAPAHFFLAYAEAF